MTALLFKNWGFPHKVFKGVQTFESKKIKETLQIQRFYHFLILPQTGIEPFRERGNAHRKEVCGISALIVQLLYNFFKIIILL